MYVHHITAVIRYVHLIRAVIRYVHLITAVIRYRGIQGRPLGWGLFRAPVLVDGLACIPYNRGYKVYL